MYLCAKMDREEDSEPEAVVFEGAENGQICKTAKFQDGARCEQGDSAGASW